MSAATATMTVTIPRFVSASTNSSTIQGDGAQPTNNWGALGDPLESATDFDLLAEYLLDDGMFALGAVPPFESSSDAPSITTQAQSGAISPKQMEDSFVDPLADAAEQLKQAGYRGQNGDLAEDLAQVQHMIAAQAEAAEMRMNGSSYVETAPAPNPVPPDPTRANTISPQPLTTPASAPLHSLLHPAPRTVPFYPVETAPAAAPLPIPAPVTVPAPMTAPMPAPPAVVSPPASSNSLPPQLPTIPSPGNKRRRIETIPTVLGVVNGTNHFLSVTTNGKSGRRKTQEQVDRRRERNRILARRTRLRKKFFFESLQKDVLDLQRENFVLKDIVQKRLEPDVAKKVLESCKASEQLPSIISEQCEENGIPTQLDQQDFNLIRSIQKSQQCFVITDPSLQDNPIVYASDDFLTLTGYARNDVLGRNCRFLQGTETHPTKVEKVRKAVEVGADCSVTMVNYTADGTAFWNNLFIAPLRDAENNIVNFIGVIVKVAAPESCDIEAGKVLESETATFMNGTDDQSLLNGNGGADDIAAAKAAEGMVMAIEGVVSAAVAAAPIIVPPPSTASYETVPAPTASCT
mmetsp:Transcript_8954/g.13184  ORF Transcript_8954/g.13184 Transcript_8954/m.13184 type:complete len:577 (-) Transcript_8954:585-2315(-)